MRGKDGRKQSRWRGPMGSKFRGREEMETKIKQKGEKPRQIRKKKSEVEEREGEGWAVIKGTGLK